MKDLPKTKKAAGGKREGAGRKDKYGEPTKVIPIRVPVSKTEVFKEKVNAILKKWETKKKK